VGEVASISDRWAAAGLRVELRGVVTLLDPDWHLLAIQDQTGGILVDAAARPPQLRVGDSVVVRGATSFDNHVRSVVAATLRIEGVSPPSQPQRVSPESVACGEILYRMVEVEIRPDEGGFGDGTHTARFATRRPCQGLVVIGRLFRRHSPASLVGRRIRVRGVPLASYSPAGQIDQVRLMFADDADVDVLEPPAADVPAARGGSLPELMSVRAVKTLPRVDADRGHPVRVEGVVTALNSRHDGYFLQDGRIGIFVFASAVRGDLPRPGERVRVRGRTQKGGYAPVIRQDSLERLGKAPLPPAVKIQPGDLFLGWEENLWVEIEAVPMALVTDGLTTQLEVASGSRRLLVWFSEGASPEALRPLLDAGISIRGVYSPLYAASGVLTGFRIFTSSPAMLKVLTPAPSESESRSIASLRQFDIRGAPRRRLRTAGSVTYRDTRGCVYLQDAGDSLRVVGSGTDDPPLHARVIAEGFLFSDAGTPQLEQVRWLSIASGPPVSPVFAAAESMLMGEQDGLLVVVEAYLESRRTSGGQLQLSLQAGRSRFGAFLEAPGSALAFPDIRPGALLRLTGVCETRLEPGATGIRQATLRLRSAADVVLVRRAAWWDLRRALYAMSALTLLMILALATAVRLRQNLLRQVALRSQLEEQLQHARKLESVGQLAGGVAHDFNNYLTVILGYSALLLGRFQRDDEIRPKLEAIRDVGGKAAALTRQLLAFSRRQVLRPTSCDLNRIITDARATLLPLIGEHIEIVVRQAPLDPVSIDPDQFFQVLVNLAVNARDAMPDGGKLTLETANVELAAAAPNADGPAAGRYVHVSVMDNGVGMDNATRGRIFDPFFTTKERGRGTGLGLAVVFGIIKQSGGHIEVQSAPGQGSCFHIYLPVAASGVREPEAPAPAVEGRGGETILVVEDQDQVRALIRTGLEMNGYRVLEASRPAEALRLLDDATTPIHLLLTDVVMPEMSGVALVAEAAARRPGMRALYMSGYSDEVVSDTCLRKPFTSDEVAVAVRRALDSPAD
jgi:signal transduction histidine kinase/CheY-like chemotaxis protein